MTLPVPTWGWHGTVYVTVSICPTVDDFCSGGYQYTRTVTQAPADAVTADLEVPANPVFVPEEDSFVTLHNPGGGKLYLVPTDTGEITAGQRTEITWRDPREAVALQAARCPTGFRPNQPTDINATRCEFFDLHRSVAAIEDVAFTAYPLHHKVITDPNAPEGTSLKVYAKGYNDVTQALSYELEDSSGTTVAGPVTWAPSYDPAGLYDAARGPRLRPDGSSRSPAARRRLHAEHHHDRDQGRPDQERHRADRAPARRQPSARRPRPLRAWSRPSATSVAPPRPRSRCRAGTTPRSSAPCTSGTRPAPRSGSNASGPTAWVISANGAPIPGHRPGTTSVGPGRRRPVRRCPWAPTARR